MSYKLSILTPEGRCFEGDVESVTAPGVTGSFGVLSHHAPMVAALQAGIVKVTAKDDGGLLLVISGGLAEVDDEGVTVLADSADKAANAADAEQKLAVVRAGG